MQPDGGSRDVSNLGPDIDEHKLAQLRDAVFASSETWHILTANEAAIAGELLSLRPPDFAGAYFHAFRSVEGFVDQAILTPAATILMSPVSAFLERQNQRPRDVLAPRFLNQLRDATFKAVCEDAADAEQAVTAVRRFENLSAFRNTVFHGFAEPTLEQVMECIDLAEDITSIVERARQNYNKSDATEKPH
jgi:hypothetical protein